MKLLSILLLASALYAQTPAPKPTRPAGQEPGATSKAGATPKSAVAAVLPDDGSLTDHIYRSEYFRFTYTIPADLEVVPDFMQAEEDAEQRSFVLLAAYSQANAEGAKSGVVIMADRAADYAPLPDGKAYLAKVTLPLATRQGYELLHPVSEHTIAGQKFYRADYRKEDVHQSFVFTVLRGYAVGFNLAAPSATEINRLFDSLQSIKFSAGKAVPKTSPDKPTAAPKP